MGIEIKVFKNKNIVYLVLYTITFVIMSAAVFSWFFLNNKSFLWCDDGIFQHFNSLVYYRTYLIDLIKNLFRSGSLNIPLWDFSLGYGGDILTTLNYYVIGDPINLLVLMVPSRFMEAAYSGLILLRLYLAGMTFSIYCWRMQQERFASFVGAFVYVFCAYALFSSVRHPFFIGPMILLPCLFIGIENIFARKGPKTFILMVFLAAISNFYFFYMMSILILVYACIRFFTLYQRPWLITFIKTVFRFMGYYVTGVMMAAIIFLPVVMQLLSSGRAQLDYAIKLLYEPDYYADFFVRFITVRSIGNWTYMGYCSIAIISILTLILTKNKYRELKIALIVLTSFIALPMAGVAFNGFSYNANRWIWGYSFLIAFIITSTMKEVFMLSWKKLTTITIVTVIYSSVVIFIGGKGNENNLKQVCLLLALLAAFITFKCVRERRGASVFVLRGIVLCTVFINIVMNANDMYAPHQRNYIDQFYDANTGISTLNDGAAKAVLGITDPSFYRYEDNPHQQKIMYNSSLQTGLNSMSFYFSLANPNIYNYLKELQTNYSNDFRYIGVDGRTFLGSLASSKYFTVSKGNEAYLPFGYHTVANTAKKDGIKYFAYQNDYVLPFGYTYDKYIDRADYEMLSPTQKQEALLQGSVLTTPDPLMERAVLDFESQKIDYEVKVGKGIQIKDHKIITSRRNASIQLSFSGLDHAELYCGIKGLSYTDSKQPNNEHKKTRRHKFSVLTFKSGKVSKDVAIQTQESIYYTGRSDYTVNMGYDELGKSSIKIVFAKKGMYTMDDITLTCQPMDHYASRITALKQDTLENVEFSTNKVAGNITLNQNKLLCLTIPYSKGWTAYVNGIETPIMNVNTMFTGVFLEPGEHQIQFKYVTPGLKIGMLISMFGGIFFVVICYNEKKNKI